jgi:hypothetical protein
MQPLPQQPQIIQPQPAPESWVVKILPNGHVAIEIHHVGGVHVSFMDGKSALRIGNDITAGGRQATSGLIISSEVPSLPPPNGQGHG